MGELENDIISAWENAEGQERIGFIKFLKKTYGENLAIILDGEAFNV